MGRESWEGPAPVGPETRLVRSGRRDGGRGRDGKQLEVVGAALLLCGQDTRPWHLHTLLELGSGGLGVKVSGPECMCVRECAVSCLHQRVRSATSHLRESELPRAQETFKPWLRPLCSGQRGSVFFPCAQSKMCLYTGLARKWETDGAPKTSPFRLSLVPFMGFYVQTQLCVSQNPRL